MEVATRRREQEVWLACDDLWAVHGNMSELTGDAIRERLLALGKSRGSPNEIYRYRKTWSISRGINSGSQHNRDQAENDPITRAVHMVHEKIQNEAAKEIDNLKKGYEEKLSQMEGELTKSQESLRTLMTEFDELAKALMEKNKKLEHSAQQLASEVKLRMATEQELSLNKSMATRDREAASQMLDEIKIAHAEEIARYRAREDATKAHSESLIDRVNQERSMEGHRYSEELIKLKIKIHNLETQSKDEKNRIETAEREANELRNLIAARNKALQVTRDEQQRQAEVITSSKAKLEAISIENEHLALKNKNLIHSLKRADVTIARLRAQMIMGFKV